MSFPREGRVGLRAFTLLREMTRKGHSCLAITSDSNHLIEPPSFHGDSMVEVIDGVDVHWVKTRKYQGAKSLGRILSWFDFEWKLWRHLRKSPDRPDAVIISSLSLLTILNGLIVRRRHKCRLIFEVRDIWPLTIVAEGGFSRFNPFVLALALVEKLAYRSSDAIVGTMPNLREHVVEVSGSSTPVHCIPMGVDLGTQEMQREVPQYYVNEYIPTNKFVVCHAGTIGITNALDTFLQCAELMIDNSSVYFLIVGDGDLKKQYQSQYGHLPNVGFAPAVPRMMVPSVLQQCDVAYFSTHPSRVWDFGQSLNKVVDYMLSGTPVIASYSGYPSMINEAGSGTYVPAGDVTALRSEIERFASLPGSQREQMGLAGRTWIVANRPYSVLAEEYLTILFPNR